MIIISQGPTTHSRIGNSIYWMMHAQFFFKKIDEKVIFPWALESYSTYLDMDSYWMNSSLEVSAQFFHKFNKELDAHSIANASRLIEHKYEIQNEIKPYSWDSLIIPNAYPGVLYLAGKIDLSSKTILNLIKGHELTILHEPYTTFWTYKDFYAESDPSFFGNDYSGIWPNKILFENETSYVNQNSKFLKSVGLHIRRGDYSNFSNGDFYYNDEFWIDRVKEHKGANKSVWIFSNDLSEKLKEKLLELGAIISNGSFEQDFVRLMLMNEIYGPPSTFTEAARRIANNCLNKDVALKFFEPKVNYQ